MTRLCPQLVDNLHIRYGKEIFNIKLPFKVELIDSNKETPHLSNDEIYKKTMTYAIKSQSLNALINKAKKILIVLPDITRKSGVKFILPYLINDICKNNKPFNIIFATGIHRSITSNEIKEIIGYDIYDIVKDKVIEHNPYDRINHIYYGKTKKGTPLLLNSAYHNSDLIITIGAITYHYFAGFGGGRKMIIPGIAAENTIINNHKLVIDEKNLKRRPTATTGKLQNNPVHNDIIEGVMITKANKTLFAINTIIDEKENLIDIVSGDLFMSHIEACREYFDMTAIKVNKKYDILIVSCGGFPKDINMVQAHKSLNRISNIAKEKAQIYFFSECIDGFGNNYFKEFFDIGSSKEMIKELIKNYHVNRQTAYSLKLLTENYDINLYSNFDEQECRKMGFKKINSIEALKTINPNNRNIAFIPNAYNYLFED
ncbi:MAG: nickel-dependent lactate racemase [Deferribacterota bacterium]|nr:nickel-dependent lactate racemase [Deferribacterota bacterium]